jgi:hypothetical protein
LIPIKEPRQNTDIVQSDFALGPAMPESRKIDREGTADRPTDQNPVSAVKLPAALTERIDSWVLAQAISRSEAIERLIELGLKSQGHPLCARRGARPAPSKTWSQARSTN